uniref:Sushi domain-containing protein n=1 Tax=Amblyomma maculatum TaxID=34609 RepID=G3MSV6_AMBMU
MQSCGWYGTLLRIILLLILLALPSASDCKWQDLEDLEHTFTTGDSRRAGVNRKDVYGEGETAPYKCSIGYLPSSSSPPSDVATCRNGKWERPPNSPLRCNPKNCGHPNRDGSFANGRLNQHVFSFPREVNFTCNRGYHLVSQDGTPWESYYRFYCQADGTWSYPTPKCVEVICPQPNPIANGQINVGTRRENSTVQYTCNPGYAVDGPTERRCTNDAKWEGNDPTCERGCHPLSPLLHGRIIGDTGDKVYKIGVTVIYDCDDGSKTTVKCIEPGRWVPEPPTCSAKTTPATPKPKTSSTTSTTMHPPPSQCSPLSSPTNGKLFSAGGFGVNASVIFSCDEGYTLRGATTLVCRPTGAWDPPTMPTCTAPPPWIIILSVCLAVLASLVICCLGFFYIMRRRRRRTPPPRAYRRQIRKPGPYDAMSNDEVARLGKPFPVTSL